MSLKIFITGANGFIGKNILELLSNKYSFYSPTHKDLDLLNYSQVESFFRNNRLFDVVIHTAIVGGNRKVPNTPEVAITNLQMFFNIARNRQYFKKMIHFGSGIEFGKEKPIRKVKEIDFDLRVPCDGFGLYKYICAKYIENSDKIINLRLFGVYGKHEDWTIRFISNAICKSIFGLPITISQNVYFDYLCIDDFVKILDYFINHKVRFKTYNVGIGKSINLLTIARKINRLAPKKSKIIIRYKGLGNEYTCDNSRLLSEIGKFKFTDFDRTLSDLYDWYLTNKKKIRKQELYDDHFN